MKKSKRISIIIVSLILIICLAGCVVYNATLDKTPPTFSADNPTEIEFVRDCQEGIAGMFEATDEISSTIITVDDSNVNYSAVGEYMATVFANDESGNVAQTEVKIKIIEPTIKLNETELKLEVGDEYVLDATTNGKDKTIKWESSDNSIATVDDNGKVVAVKSGSVTIKTSANGVEATCSVVVKEVVTETTTKVTTQKQETSKDTSSTNKKSTSNNPTTTTKKNTSSNNKKDNTSTTKKNNSSSSSSTTTSHYWCDEGGTHHIINKGIGWYNTYDEATNAALAILSENENFDRFEVQECDCGLFTAYVR